MAIDSRMAERIVIVGWPAIHLPVLGLTQSHTLSVKILVILNHPTFMALTRWVPNKGGNIEGPGLVARIVYTRVMRRNTSTHHGRPLTTLPRVQRQEVPISFRRWTPPFIPISPARLLSSLRVTPNRQPPIRNTKVSVPCKAGIVALGATVVPLRHLPATRIRSGTPSSNEHFLPCNCRDILPPNRLPLQEIQVHPHSGGIKIFIFISISFIPSFPLFDSQSLRFLLLASVWLLNASTIVALTLAQKLWQTCIIILNAAKLNGTINAVDPFILDWIETLASINVLPGLGSLNTLYSCIQ